MATPKGQYVLEGITRGTVLDLAGGLGLATAECDLDLFDAYTADEAFLTSTSLCICPISSVKRSDRRRRKPSRPGDAQADARIQRPGRHGLRGTVPLAPEWRGIGTASLNFHRSHSFESPRRLSCQTCYPESWNQERRRSSLPPASVFTEGPLWHPDGYWLFVDIRASLVHRMTPDGTDRGLPR